MSRNIIDHEVFQNGNLLRVFLYCLVKASWEEGPKKVRGVRLNKGQFVHGLLVATEVLKIPRTTIYRNMKKLEDLNIIEMKVEPRLTIITVLNYSIYQDLKTYYGTKWERKRNSSGTETETKKELKELNKKKKYIKKKKFLDFVYLTEEEYQKLCDQFTEPVVLKKIQALDDYVAYKGAKYKDHYRTILAWHRKDEGKQKSVDKYAGII
ncbi:MAG: hypothetical protein GY797_08955 [Deltaproteobacteria bacterium]|nr:hypothetical protein [Deltaproteobacteria bacterium]